MGLVRGGSAQASATCTARLAWATKSRFRGHGDAGLAGRRLGRYANQQNTPLVGQPSVRRLADPLYLVLSAIERAVARTLGTGVLHFGASACRARCRGGACRR